MSIFRQNIHKRIQKVEKKIMHKKAGMYIFFLPRSINPKTHKKQINTISREIIGEKIAWMEIRKFGKSRKSPKIKNVATIGDIKTRWISTEKLKMLGAKEMS